MSIDYRELLKRYIRHVGEYEGVAFIYQDYLSAEDYAELSKLEDEAWGERESERQSDA